MLKVNNKIDPEEHEKVIQVNALDTVRVMHEVMLMKQDSTGYRSSFGTRSSKSFHPNPDWKKGNS